MEGEKATRKSFKGRSYLSRKRKAQRQVQDRRNKFKKQEKNMDILGKNYQ